MRRISAADFKARCLALMDEVARTGEPIVVTKRWRPAARSVADDAGAGTALSWYRAFREPAGHHPSRALNNKEDNVLFLS